MPDEEPKKEEIKQDQPVTDDLSQDTKEENISDTEAHEASEDIKPTEVTEAEKTDSEDKSKDKSNEKHLNIKGFFKWYWSWKKWLIPLTVLILILIILLIPFTRYGILGLFIKEPYTVTLTDSTTNTAISGAVIKSGNISAVTNAKGKASLKLSVGHHTLDISKQYYKSSTEHVLVTTSSSKDVQTVQLVATGRQVPIKIVNLITGKGIEGAEIKVLNTESKTDSSGNSVIVVPATSGTENATVNGSGYNNENVKLTVTSNTTSANTFKLTPSGKVYFLSKLTGKIDVDETNLDGSDRQTVLAGTGNESDTDTVLLASRDWKYLALLAKRTPTENPELDLITSSNNQMTNIDEGNATFTPVGWDKDSFIYTVTKNTVMAWQSGQEELKSYNATTKQTTVLDQTTASGTSSNDYVGQSITNPYILSNAIVYTKGWNSAYSPSNIAQVETKSATLNSVQPDGSGKASIKSFAPASGTQVGSLNLTLAYPNVDVLDIDFYDGNQDNYFQYKNGQVSQDSSLSEDDFYSSASDPTYLLSPSGDKTFWSESRDGANTLFVGDAFGNNSNQIATLSPYDSYGWYSDSYLLVSKNSSELYIMPVSGGTPTKITDYHKPSVTFNGYGGGYGGR
jgi:hypothetical protein